MKKVTMLTLALCLMAAVAAGCALVDAAQNPTPDPAEVVDPTPPQEPARETATVVLYFADSQAAKVEAETREIVIEGTLAETIVNELINGPQSEDLFATLPEGTALLDLVIEDGIAYVDFSKELKTNHWGGSAGELMTVQSIVATLCQLDEVDSVQLLLEGEKEEAIFGHGCTAEPIEPDPNFIAS